jgi:hypothetical protein
MPIIIDGVAQVEAGGAAELGGATFATQGSIVVTSANATLSLTDCILPE